MTLRKQPSDFIVQETLAPGVRESWRQAWSPEAPFAVLEVRKESLTTPEAAGILCKAFHVKSGSAEYAGLKDKHALTTQHMTIKVEDARAKKWPMEASGPRWSARVLGYSDQHITAKAIDRNRFEIVVRDLSRAAVGEMNERAVALSATELSGEQAREMTHAPEARSDAAPGTQPETQPETESRTHRHSPAPATLRLINYFGDQRFGSARHGQGFAARHLVKGEFEPALKLLIATPARKDSGARRDFTRAAAQHWGQWPVMLEKLPKIPERAAIETLSEGGTMRDAFAALPHFVQQLSVEAYQSFLWNEAARRLVEMLAKGAAGVGGSGAKVSVLRAVDDFGELVFPRGVNVPADWLTTDMPSPGPGMPAMGLWLVAMDGALRAEKLRAEDLAIPGLRRPDFGVAMRPLVIEARNFEMSAALKDELASKTSPKNLKRTVRFDLPRGAYATIVLRALGE